jgi:hypothetical protein
MDAINDIARPGTRWTAVFLRATVVLLTLTTAAVHASLGGFLFTMNALGYAAFAVAMVLPGPFGRIRWLVRVALIGFTLATIGGWVLFGARFPLAYVDKGVEVALVVFLAIELWLFDGGPFGIAQRTRRLASAFAATVATRGAR